MTRARWLYAGLAALLVLMAWWGTARYAVAGIQVTWDGPPVCRGTVVKQAEDIAELADSLEDPDATAWDQIIVARPGMECTVDVRIINRGRLPVRVHELVADFAGEDGGGVLEGVGGEVPEGPFPDMVARHHPIHRTIGSGETLRWPLELRYRPDGCMDGWSSWPHWPAVHVSAWGVPRTVGSLRDLQYESVPHNPGCPMGDDEPGVLTD